MHDIWFYYAQPRNWTKDTKSAFGAFLLLARCEKLQTFGLRLKEDKYLGQTARIHNPEDVPGVKQIRLLRSIQALSFEHCHEVTMSLDPEMSKPKTGGSVAAGTKRKRDDDWPAAWLLAPVEVKRRMMDNLLSKMSPVDWAMWEEIWEEHDDMQPA